MVIKKKKSFFLIFYILYNINKNNIIHKKRLIAMAFLFFFQIYKLLPTFIYTLNNNAVDDQYKSYIYNKLM